MVSVLRETLNPKVLGNSSKSRFNRVLFPEPDGPASTSGRCDPILVPESDPKESCFAFSFGGFFEAKSASQPPPLNGHNRRRMEYNT